MYFKILDSKAAWQPQWLWNLPSNDNLWVFQRENDNISYDKSASTEGFGLDKDSVFLAI